MTFLLTGDGQHVKLHADHAYGAELYDRLAVTKT